MSVKSVIDVEINSAAFERFTALFDKYQEALKEGPSLWSKVEEAQDGVAEGFTKMTAALLAVHQLSGDTREEQEKYNKTLGVTQHLWSSIAKSGSALLGSVTAIGKSLLKWGTLVGGGLLGGSLWGLDKLASGTAADRRSAMGLGLTIGQEKAFGLNFGRLTDPGGFLAWVNEMETDVTKRAPASILGARLGGNAGSDALSLLQAVRSFAKRTPTGLLGTLGNAYGLPFDSQTLTRFQSMGDKEFQSLVTNFQSDQHSLNVGNGAAETWQNFMTSLERSGDMIKKTLVEGLAPLAGPIEHLSSAFVHLIERVVSNNDVKGGIDNFAKWIQDLSGKVAKPEFLAKMDQFVGDMSTVADKLHWIAHPMDAWDKANQGFQEWQYGGHLRTLSLTAGLPANLLKAIWMQESGGHLVDKNGQTIANGAARGPFQILQSNLLNAGIDPENPDADAEAKWAQGFVKQLYGHFHHDVSATAAGYVLGQDAVDKLLKKWGNDWVNHVEDSAYGKQNHLLNYIRNVTRDTGAPGVLINNLTGANIEITARPRAGGSLAGAGLQLAPNSGFG